MSAAASGPETAPDQVARLLALVPYLLARGEVRLDEAAAHFGVSPAQLDKDLRLLFLTGLSPGLPGDLIEVDIDALEGEGVIRVDNADYLARPVRFAPAEATALIVALRTMLDGAEGEARGVLERTLAKLEEVAGADPETLLSLHVDEPVVPGDDLVPLLEGAIARGHQVRLDYHVPTRDERSQRVVDPRGVTRVENVHYLDAWCHTADGDRVFRLDRILSAEELDTPVEDPSRRPRDLTQGWFSDEQVAVVTLRLEPPAFWVSEYYPVLERREGPDGTLEVALEVASDDWLTRLLLRVAPHATVVEPEGRTTAFVAQARNALRLYGTDG
ncbi:MAG: WYL domain-containing protein [Nocardioides sp.]|nr:WYL domain-containing protein [Nocardioides sp.]